MKKTFALILAIALIVCLFAGCGGSTTGGETAPAQSGETAQSSGSSSGSTNSSSSGSSGSSSSSSSSGSSSGSSESGSAQTQPEENGDYHFAPGKFAADARGIATEKYDYELPFCNTDETLTFWTVSWNPEYIPEEGFDTMEFPQEIKRQTGVNVEYTIISRENMQANFAVLVAADDLRDLMMHGVTYYNGTVKDAVEDGYFINIYDYRDYCPNYMYESVYRDPSDKATYAGVFYEDDFVYSFWDLYSGPAVDMGPVIRTDWARELGYEREDIVTWDQMYDIMVGMKAKEFTPAPWQMMSTLEIKGSKFFAAFDTTGYVDFNNLQDPFQIDNKVQMLHITDADKELMTYVNKCWNAGLIDPDWSAAQNNNDYQLTKADQTGLFNTTSFGIGTLEAHNSDPDAEYSTIHKLQRSVNQTLHTGMASSRVSYGETCVSAKCENIPLAVTWCDFRYADQAFNLMNYGVQGLTWDYNDQGEVELTDFVLNHPEGLSASWVPLLYAMNDKADCGLEDPNRKQAYPEGKRYTELGQIWYNFDYDGAWEWPFSLHLTDEETQSVNEYAGDYVTYIAENFTAFVDGSKPLSDWDSYVQGAMDIGGRAIADIYQNALDNFNA